VLASEHLSLAKAIRTTNFWLVVAGALLTVLNQGLGWNLPTQDVLAVLAVLISYILGSSHIAAQHVAATAHLAAAEAARAPGAGDAAS